jgi:lysophospholipase L1-like esterase
MVRFLRVLLVCAVCWSPAAAGRAQTPAAPPPADAAARQLEVQQRLLNDWPNLARYREDNAKLGPPAASEKRVVFMGDSITDAWGRRRDVSFFAGKPYVNRGISGQTTPQMLIRFRPDVIDLHPAVVVILAGINDIAENTGPTTLEAIEGNLTSMVELAQANDIRVVLATVTPAVDFPWRKGMQPAPKISALNTWIREFTKKRGIVLLDYYAALAGPDGDMKPGLASDGVHPTDAGYAVMGPLAEKAIAEALQRPVKQ